MIGPWFTEALEGISGNPPPTFATILPALNREYERPIFPTFQPIGDRDVKASDKGVSLFAIRGQEEGPIILNDWSVIYGRH